MQGDVKQRLWSMSGGMPRRAPGGEGSRSGPPGSRVCRRLSTPENLPGRAPGELPALSHCRQREFGMDLRESAQYSQRPGSRARLKLSIDGSSCTVVGSRVREAPTRGRPNCHSRHPSHHGAAPHLNCTTRLGKGRKRPDNK